MANMMLASPVIGDAAVITGSATSAQLPLQNLKRMAIGAVTRFLSPAGAYIKADLGSARSIDLVALLGHNATVTGEVRVRAAHDEGNLVDYPDYDSGPLRMRSNIVAPDYVDVGSLARNHFILHLPVAESYRWWRIDIADSGQYLDIGRLYLSKAFQPEVNMDYGEQFGLVDPSTIHRARSGRVIPNEQKKYRFQEFTLSFASEAEMYGDSFDIESERGSTRDVLFIYDYDNKPLLQKRSIYGRMLMYPTINPHWRLFEKTYRIEEIAE